MQEKIERVCKKCGKVNSFLWKEITRWMRNNKGRALDDYYCDSCAKSVRMTTHGESQVKLYTHWKSMFIRIKGSAGSEATRKAYLEKGIQVCPEWYDYTAFKKWAESNGFKPGLVINRIDSSKNYCPENCEWLTKSEHASKDWRVNRRS